MSELQNVITNEVDGVASVTNITITNDNTFSSIEGYSGNRYNIGSATIDGIVYPAKDPSIFEVKLPNKDIFTSVDGGEG